MRGFWIQRGGVLVQQQQPGVLQRCHQQRQRLTLSPRKKANLAGEPPLQAEVKHLQLFFVKFALLITDAPTQRAGSAAAVGHGKVFFNAHVPGCSHHRVLKHTAQKFGAFVLRQFGNVRAVQHDAARICGINARNKVEHRGFACAVSADDCDKITVVQCEAEILNRPFFIDGAWIEHLMDVFQFQHTAHSFPAGTGVNLDFRNFFCNAGTLSASATVTALNSLRSSVERPSCSTKAITI